MCYDIIVKLCYCLYTYTLCQVCMCVCHAFTQLGVESKCRGLRVAFSSVSEERPGTTGQFPGPLHTQPSIRLPTYLSSYLSIYSFICLIIYVLMMPSIYLLFYLALIYTPCINLYLYLYQQVTYIKISDKFFGSINSTYSHR